MAAVDCFIVYSHLRLLELSSWYLRSKDIFIINIKEKLFRISSSAVRRLFASREVPLRSIDISSLRCEISPAHSRGRLASPEANSLRAAKVNELI
ncbi:MAG: hypothetical protein IAB76_01685 [Bacteroidetes bacterium]|uniref:Uncharacterized protein n=1 Tax=Candidatus Cryptobacteroides avistercoris TaxID=2840758 RepID=A0A9D9IXC3_9BACT|nr:hypothetical protein [Candidatus Cryptobacteroides avistercoris]